MVYVKVNAKWLLAAGPEYGMQESMEVSTQKRKVYRRRGGGRTTRAKPNNHVTHILLSKLLPPLTAMQVHWSALSAHTHGVLPFKSMHELRLENPSGGSLTAVLLLFASYASCLPGACALPLAWPWPGQPACLPAFLFSSSCQLLAGLLFLFLRAAQRRGRQSARALLQCAALQKKRTRLRGTIRD